MIKMLQALGVTAAILFAIWLVETTIDTLRPRTPAAFRIALMFGVGVLVFLLALRVAGAQDGHTHEGAVGRFYQSWTMPDAPYVSCCHDQDCSPAASKFENGRWWAERDGEWISIPEYKIEQNRDSPDGRSHLCGRRSPNLFTVFCFIRGGGA